MSTLYKLTIVDNLQEVSDRLAKLGTGLGRTFSGVAQKTAPLTSSVNDLRTKLDELTKRRDISLDGREVKALNKEISQTENQLRKLDNTKLPNMQSQISGLSMAFAGWGFVAIEAVRGFVNASVGIGISFEAEMSKVQALTSATATDMASLEKQAKELGSTTKFSATQAAEAMSFLGMAGFDTAQIMSAVPGVMTLAAAGNIDLARAADIASNALTAYGMEASRIGEVNDLIAATITTANVNMEQFAEAFKFAAPLAKANGIAIEELSAAIGLLGNAGIQGSLAGTGLQTAISRLVKPSREAQKVIDELGLTVQDSSGKLLPFANILGQLETAGASSAQVLQIFGIEAGGKMQALLEQGSQALADYTDRLRESGGTAENLAQVMSSNTQGAIDSLNSAVEGLGISLFQKLSPAINGTISVLTNLARWAGENTWAFDALGAGLLAAATAFGVAKIATLGFSGAFAALNAVMVANPIGLVVTAIGALVAGAVAAYQNFEGFRNLVDSVFQSLVSVGQGFSDLATRIQDDFNSVLKSLGFETTSKVKVQFDSEGLAVPVVPEVSDAEIEAIKKALAEQLKADPPKVKVEVTSPDAELIAGVMKQLADATALADAKFAVFGESFDLLKAKQAAYAKAISELLEKGISPFSTAVQNLKAQLDALSEVPPIRFDLPTLETGGLALPELVVPPIQGTEVFAQLRAEMEMISKQAEVFGDSFDMLVAKKKALTDALNELLLTLEPTSPMIQVLKEQLENLGEGTAKSTDAFVGFATGIVNSMGQIAQGVFEGSLSAIEAVRRVIKALVAEAVAAMIAGSIKKNSLLGPAALPIAAAAGGAVAALADAIIPKFATGGLVSGETLGIIGEGIGTSAANPEVIAPLDRLKSMISDSLQGSGGQTGSTDMSLNVGGEFRVSGEDLVLLLNRQIRKMKSYTGMSPLDL